MPAKPRRVRSKVPKIVKPVERLERAPTPQPAKPKHTALLISVSVIFLLTGTAFGLLTAPLIAAPAPTTGPQAPSVVSLDAVSTNGYVQVEPSVDTENVYFTAGCTRVGMATTDFQTYSIQNGINKIIEIRPTVHDVLKDLVDSYGMEALLVKLDSKDGTEAGYYANLFLKQGSKIVSLETRPSDATALAVRTGAKIWFQQSTFTKLGQDSCT